MSDFGTKGLFICAVIGGLAATAQVGWPGVFGIFTIVIGYLYLTSAMNSTFRPDGSLRRRRRR